MVVVVRKRAPAVTDELPGNVRQLLETIRARLFDPETTATAVCSRCGIRNHNVHSQFKMLLGESMREYIERERMDAAKQLLRDPEVYVYEVADAVGYAHVETFSRAFRRQVGCTPGEFQAYAARDRGRPRAPVGPPAAASPRAVRRV